MATYSTAAFAAEEVDRLPTHDNLFCYKARRNVKHYSAHSYSGTSNGLSSIKVACYLLSASW